MLPISNSEDSEFINAEHSFWTFKSSLSWLLSHMLITVKTQVSQRVYGKMYASKSNFARLLVSSGNEGLLETSDDRRIQFIHEENAVRRVRVKTQSLYLDIINLRTLSHLLGSSYWYYPVIPGKVVQYCMST